MLLVIVIGLAPMALGARAGLSLVAATVLALISAVLFASSASFTIASLARVTAVVLLAAAALALLQAAPLPCDWIAVVAPRSAAIAPRVAELLGEPSTMCTFSPDPGATAAEAWKSLGILATFIAAVGAAQRDRAIVMQVIGASSAAMAIVAITHELVGAELIFGIWPAHRAAQIVLLAPLWNQNHLAAYTALGVPIYLGLALRDELMGRRLVYLAGATLCATTALFTLSHSGALSVVLGAGLALLLGVGRREQSTLRRAAFMAFGAAATGLVAWAAYELSYRLADDAERAARGKARLLGTAIDVVRDHAWLGVGRGALGLEIVARGLDVGTPHFAENVFIQWAGDYGVPFAAFLLVVLGVCVVLAIRRSRSRLVAVGGAALIAFTIQNLADLSIEIPAIALTVAALFGAVLAPDRPGRNSGTKGRVVIAALGLTTLPALALVPLVFGHTTFELLRALDAEESIPAREALAKAGIRAHPGEPQFAAVLATTALAEDDCAAGLAWSDLGRDLAPGWSAFRVRRLSALDCFGRRAEVVEELAALVATDRSDSTFRVACAATRDATSLNLVMRIAPRPPDRVPFLDRIAGQCLTNPVAVADLDRVLRAEAPRLLGPRIRRARRFIEQRRPERALTELDGAAPGPEIVLLRAQALVAAGRAREAVAELEASLPQATNRRAVLDALARAAASAGEPERMRAAIEGLRGEAAGERGGLAAASRLHGSLEAQLGNDELALGAYEAAFRIDESPGDLAAIAQIAERLGDMRQALRAYRTLCDQQGEGGPACVRLTAIEARQPSRSVQGLRTPDALR